MARIRAARPVLTLALICCFYLHICARMVDRPLLARGVVSSKANRGTGTSFLHVRGGSNSDDKMVDAGNGGEQTEETRIPAKIKVAVSTGGGTRFIDQRCQIELPGTATLSDLKKEVTKRLAAAPPAAVQKYFYQTTRLDDEKVLGEILVAEAEEEATAAVEQAAAAAAQTAAADEENGGEKAKVTKPPVKPPTGPPTLSLLLDMVPPQASPEEADDPACAVPAAPEDRLRAYAANAAAAAEAARAYFGYVSGEGGEDGGGMLSPRLRDAIAHTEELAAALPVTGPPRDPKDFIIPPSQRTGTALDRARARLARELDLDPAGTLRLLALVLLLHYGAVGPWRAVMRLAYPALLLLKVRTVRLGLKVARHAVPRVPGLTNYLGSVLPAQHLQLLTLDEDAYLAGLYADGMRGGAPAPPPERSYDWLVEQNEISILGGTTSSENEEEEWGHDSSSFSDEE